MSAQESKRGVVLILGGVRSGKSRYAQQLASCGKQVAFIATAEGRDEEMTRRIVRHRADRPPHWVTVETPTAVADAILNCDGKFDTILVDCLTLWASNLMEHECQDNQRVLSHADRLVDALRQVRAKVILVSNEVGGGIVPQNEMARLYRDILGAMNQRVAAVADEVVLMVAGCPLMIKHSAQKVPVEACGAPGPVARDALQ